MSADKQDKIERLVINEVAYIREDSVPNIPPAGPRAVVVVDRGWIFAGDVTEKDGRVYLSRAVHVFSWKAVGFAKMLEEPKKHADIRPLKYTVDIPKECEIFRIPVDSSWGL
jgi:hypothetical protein